MTQKEMDLIAKMIRNCDWSLEQKEHLVRKINQAMLRENQFWDHVRFKRVAVQGLPDGWPNRVDQKWMEKQE